MGLKPTPEQAVEQMMEAVLWVLRSGSFPKHHREPRLSGVCARCVMEQALEAVRLSEKGGCK